MSKQFWIEVGHGVAVSSSTDAKPSIQWNHIDGPLLYGRGGQIHWLTIRERLAFAFSRADAMSLEKKHWPDFVERWNAVVRAPLSTDANAAPTDGFLRASLNPSPSSKGGA